MFRCCDLGVATQVVWVEFVCLVAYLFCLVWWRFGCFAVGFLICLCLIVGMLCGRAWFRVMVLLALFLVCVSCGWLWLLVGCWVCYV